MPCIKTRTLPDLSTYIVKAKAMFLKSNREYMRIYDPNNTSNECCTLCKKACGDCEWSKHLQPIDGWIAAPTNNAIKNGFKIFYCPEFEEGTATAEDYDQEACIRLLEKLCEDSGDEYRECCRVVKECRQELKSSIVSARSKLLSRYGDALSQMRMIEQFIGDKNAETLRKKCNLEDDPVYDEIAWKHSTIEEE